MYFPEFIILLNNGHSQYSITEDKIEDIHNDAYNEEDDGHIFKRIKSSNKKTEINIYELAFTF